MDEVQAYLRKKFKKNDKANYGRYGIVKENKTYQFPKDRDERKESLLLMKEAIAIDGFGDEEYGTLFWTTMISDYNKAFNSAKTIDGGKSTNVGSKNVSKDAIRKVLVSLRHVIVGNYPDTYTEEVRAWGWQKEDY